MDVDYEDYYPPHCLHCEMQLSHVNLVKSYSWKQGKDLSGEYIPSKFNSLFICPSCTGEVGEMNESGEHVWFTEEDFPQSTHSPL